MMEMFDFGSANAQQQEAIRTTEGPLLLIAGPGTGKTYTLVQRAIYLIQERGVQPQEIFMATFTEKAAQELITRMTNELAARGLKVNINEMYVGTFHSLCLRLLEEYQPLTSLQKNFRVLEQFDQYYLVFQNMELFKDIDNLDQFFATKNAYTRARYIANIATRLGEELVDVEGLMTSADPSIAVIGGIMTRYHHMLVENNLLDFASIQVNAYQLLQEHPQVLRELQQKLKYIMVDEYQDTNYVQEQIALLLAGKQQNLCVVGDDDQGLYRFRGATVRNILEFPAKFAHCHTVRLVVNYRSEPGIIDFYNRWMDQQAQAQFGWDNCRHGKTILPSREAGPAGASVLKLSVVEDEEQWQQQVLRFLQQLKRLGKLQDYNQVAFLFRSVKRQEATSLASFLEAQGIQVYSPRSDMFFQRQEIRLALGCLMALFPNYVNALFHNQFAALPEAHYAYFQSCFLQARELAAQPGNEDLQAWIRQLREEHKNLQGTTDYAYAQLFYRLLQFRPFRELLDRDLQGNVNDARPLHNLAILSQILNQYEYLHQVEVLTAAKLEQTTVRLFNIYLRLLLDGGLNEFEDFSSYAPSGCVSFLTIHQAKGMEFPIVFVGSLGDRAAYSPKGQDELYVERILAQYARRAPYEPPAKLKFFDFWRLYYTAFSRAQDLLVLTCVESGGWRQVPSSSFQQLYTPLPSWQSAAFRPQQLQLHQLKELQLKPIFSFTSHLMVYNTCPRQYKFYKELGFAPVRSQAIIFGTLVHQTLEDIHQAALRGREQLIKREQIAEWLEDNYQSLAQREHKYLAPPQREAALQQVLAYVAAQQGKWSQVRAAELDVSLVKPAYILEGTVDLVRQEKEGLLLVDFKSEGRPRSEAGAERLQRYQQQLYFYAQLVQERMGQPVTGLQLYYTGEKQGSPQLDFVFDQQQVDQVLQGFDATAHAIMAKRFQGRAQDGGVCNNCDFRYYCYQKEQNEEKQV